MKGREKYTFSSSLCVRRVKVVSNLHVLMALSFLLSFFLPAKTLILKKSQSLSEVENKNLSISLRDFFGYEGNAIILADKTIVNVKNISVTHAFILSSLSCPT